MGLFDIFKTITEEKVEWFSFKNDVKFNGGDTELNINNALWLAEFSRLSYEQDSEYIKNITSTLGYDFLWFDRHDTEAFIIYNDVDVIIAFRGTEVTSWKDIMTDISASKIETENCNKVHKGFYIALQKIWDDIDDWLDANLGQRNLIITGHSLGGALAVLASSRLKDKVKCVYTFGSPKVGNKNFYNYLKDNVRHYRFVNSSDPIPLLPLFFKHTGMKILLLNNNDIIINPKLKNYLTFRMFLRYFNVLLSIKKHYMKQYLNNIKNVLYKGDN